MKQTRTKSPVTIRYKQLKDGSQSIYLDIYRDGRRRYEFLKLYLVPGRSPMAKIQNENTMTAALAREAQLIKEITSAEAGLQIERPEANMKLTELIMRLIADKKRRGDTTICQQILLACIKEYAQDPPIKIIDKAWCREFSHWLQDRKIQKRKDEEKVGMKSSTINLYMVLLTGALTYAVESEWIKTNAMKELPAKDRVQVKVPPRDYLTQNELRALEAAGTGDSVVKKAFLFSCYTGLRRSDIERLSSYHIAQNGDAYEIHLVMKKTKDDIVVPIPNHAMQYIDVTRPGRIFPIPEPPATNKQLKAWARENGIDKNVTFHIARHTYATLALTLGVDIYTISKLLGHSTIATTQIYAKLVDTKKRQAADLFDKFSGEGV